MILVSSIPTIADAVPGSILKIEDVNYHDGAQRQLLGYSVSAKRYALFTREDLGIQVRKASAHGLGYLFAPNKEYDDALDALQPGSLRAGSGYLAAFSVLPSFTSPGSIFRR